MYSLYKSNYIQREVVDWALAGSPLPAPHPVKVLHLAWLLQISGLKRFIETGTLAGNTSGMIGLMPDMRVDTIEITRHYFDLAREKFAANPSVFQHFGDSTYVLPDILSRLTEPALFWLDAHHSMGKTGCGAKLTPVSEELEAILNHPVDGHIVAIDDIRSFKGRADYPTLEAVTLSIKNAKPHYSLVIRHDILTLAPTDIVSRLETEPFRMKSSAIIARE
jgi:hypothetical protein